MRASILVAPVLLLAMQTAISAADPPEAVRAWLNANVGRWENVGGVQPAEVGKYASELTAGGKVLLTRGTTGDGVPFVSIDAWEADKEKLVTTIYLADGAYLRRWQDVEKRAISGTVEGLDGDGRTFSGRLTAKLTGRGVIESIYEGSLAGKQVVLKWKATRMPAAAAEGGQPADMPVRAREALSFFVADWEAERHEGDKNVGTSVDRRAWAAGKHCLLIDWSGTNDGVPWRASGITGWDAKANAIIEYWHGSYGQSLVVCYPLDKMTPTVWEGTSCSTTADGTSNEGPCRLTKTPDGYEFVASSKRDGKETVFRSVARRLKGEQSAAEAVKAAEAKPENIPEKAMAAMKYFAGAWKGEGEATPDGIDVAGHDRRYWVPGAHALRIEWSGAHDGVPSHFSGLVGWDPKTKALVEHWFGSRGMVNNNSYPVDRMKGNVWQGTFSFIRPDGQYVEGESTFTANPEEGIWVGRSTQAGKEAVYKSVARKVKE